jgi:hypothetical protein
VSRPSPDIEGEEMSAILVHSETGDLSAPESLPFCEFGSVNCKWTCEFANIDLGAYGNSEDKALGGIVDNGSGATELEISPSQIGFVPK